MGKTSPVRKTRAGWSSPGKAFGILKNLGKQKQRVFVFLPLQALQPTWDCDMMSTEKLLFSL